MSKRAAEQTVEKAIPKIFPKITQADIRVALTTQPELTVRNLRDAEVDGIALVENVLSAFEDTDYIHKSVAAIYCRRSENVLERAIAKTAMTEGDTQTRKTAKGSGNHFEIEYRVGFIKKVADTIERTYAAGYVSRSKKAKAKVKSVVHAATDIKLAWITDDDGTIYIPLTMPDGSGGLRMGRLIKNGAHIELLTLAQAMTERTWNDPADRAPWHKEYIAILEEEVQRANHQQDESARANCARLLGEVPGMDDAPEPPPRKTL